ncbi:carbohydrate kinase family protein [Thalassomonas viridans]|uniref:Carbohydrate kinase family protein n=1 Tax=Thalassomonas viridans TaxID=137584 RepID=A0AAE9Z127_9GAMM|nr:carbohydrate kinase family protein [Thalassomonas viridans]WDE04623.1 carbohydrate kinase family protein [Thalassomonas viridans]
MTQAHVFIIGGTSIDSIIHLHQPLTAEPQTVWAKSQYFAVGGTGAGKALNLSRLGHQVCLHTCLGDDEPGREIIAGLQHKNIELLVETVPVPTEQHTNIMSPHGERISIYTQPPSDDKNYDMTEIERVMAKTDIAAVGILDYTRPTLALAKKYRKPLWIDLHDYDGENPYHQEFIDAADVIFVASDNLPDYENFMRQQIALGKQLVVCTHGKGGSTALDAGGNWYRQDIIPGYELVDSNGAGDAYFSGFLTTYLQGEDVQLAMENGSRVAAMCINSDKLYHEQLTQDTLKVPA